MRKVQSSKFKVQSVVILMVAAVLCLGAVAEFVQTSIRTTNLTATNISSSGTATLSRLVVSNMVSTGSATFNNAAISNGTGTWNGTIPNITQILNRDHSNLTGIGTNSHATIDAFIASKGLASGLASLNSSTLVIQNPASATSTPTGTAIVMADPLGRVNSWVTGTAPLVTSGVNTFSGATRITGNPKFSLKLSGNQAITSNVLTKVSFTTVVQDTAGICSGGTCTTNVAGHYAVSVSPACDDGAGLTYMEAQLLVNGALTNGGFCAVYLPTTNPAFCPIVMDDLYLNGTTDKFEVWVKCIGTGTVFVTSSAGYSKITGHMIP
jgi:hypothetical protein